MKRRQALRSDPAKIRAWQRRTALRASKRQADRDLDRYQLEREARRAFARGMCEADGMHAPGCTGLGTEAHHVQRRSDGGGDGFDNLRWVHPDCHARIHSRPNEARDRGMLQ